MKFQNQCYMTKSLLETNIFNYHTPEFFINMKNIPDKSSQERKAFVLEEKRKCREGININGIYIPGSLYFHLNYYHLQGDDLKTGKKSIFLPRLRDNEWVIFNDYDQCKKESKLYPLFGARQIAKSEIETSLCLGELCLFSETEALALFSGQPDKDTFVKKISTAITNGEKFMIIPNIDKDWSKELIRFGFTKQDNTTEIRSRLYIYNTQEGKKIQVGSGKSVSFLLMDEIAKSDFKSVYDTIEPALLSDLGTLRCSPILAFTGGETDKARDAKNLVENPIPETQFTSYLDNKLIGGRFMSGLYRKDCKEEKTFSEYIGKKTNTWLDEYPIYVSNFEKASEKIAKEKEDALKSPEKNSYLLKRIFYPLNLDDVFLTESNNKFPIEVIKQHQTWLNEHYEPAFVELYRDKEGKVQWKYSAKKPLRKFPVSPSDDKDSCIEVYEFPIQDAPRFTYCIGIDLVNISGDSTSKEVSLFSICVYKRKISPLDEFKDQVVASIAYRPKELSDAHELAVMVAEWYNAVGGVLPEASENSLFQYFYLKRKGHFLADSFDLSQQINPKTKFKGKKGLAATTSNQRHYLNLLIEAANREEISISDEGDEVLTYGVTLEHDVMLLEEYKEYKSHQQGKGVHDGNYDRFIARGCAETLARFYDVKYPIAQMPKSIRKEENVQHSKTINTPFGRITSKDNSVNFNYSSKENSIPRWMRR